MIQRRHNHDSFFHVAAYRAVAEMEAPRVGRITPASLAEDTASLFHVFRLTFFTKGRFFDLLNYTLINYTALKLWISIINIRCVNPLSEPFILIEIFHRHASFSF